MCYLPPGPRCSNHAQQSLMKALRLLEEETDVNKKLFLQERYDEAEKDYYATKRGQNDLLREIALLTTEVKTDSTKLSELSDLRLKLREGQVKRQNQLLAYAASQAHKQTLIKDSIASKNKNLLAVGITFNALLDKMEEQSSYEIHSLSNNLIQVTDISNFDRYNILCIPQKYQTQVDVYDMTTGKLEVSSDNTLTFLLNKYQDNTDTFTETDTQTLHQWVSAYFVDNNIKYIASVDTRTETIKLLDPLSLFTQFSIILKKKPKYGGTSPYRFGLSETLAETLQSFNLETPSVEVVEEKGVKQTYLFNTRFLLKEEIKTENFFFSLKRTPSGEPYYEIRVRHKPSKMEIYLTFVRNESVIARNDLSILDNNIQESS